MSSPQHPNETPTSKTDNPSSALPDESAFDVNDPAGETEMESDAEPGRDGSSALPDESAFNVNGPADDA